ncbi:MAG: class I SAM-dependent methyltransferase [Candidatus Pacebacteria bacterium]|nr:class I SAM-dependent methyltransferase [Candidatus Paceibacterota bacterium]
MSIGTKAKKAFGLVVRGDVKSFSSKFDTYFINKLNFFSVNSTIKKSSVVKEKFLSKRDVGQMVDEVFLIKTIKPTQVRSEIIRLLDVVKERNVRKILEVGTANGGTIFFFSQVAADDAIVASVDVPNRFFGYGYPAWRARIYGSFPKKSQTFELVRGDSHSQETFQNAAKTMRGNDVDFLFIDGDHSYEGVKRDFEMYGQLVRPGGVIAFHDIVDGNEEFVGGVPRFWKEIRDKYPHDEFVEDWKQGGLGIGVLYV